MDAKTETNFDVCPKCGAPLVGKREAACGTKWSGSGNIVQSRVCVYVLRLTTEAKAIMDHADDIKEAALTEAKATIDSAKATAEKVYPEMVEMVRSDFRAKVATILSAPEAI